MLSVIYLSPTITFYFSNFFNAQSLSLSSALVRMIFIFNFVRRGDDLGCLVC